jgi:hypothetical protein
MLTDAVAREERGMCLRVLSVCLVQGLVREVC